MDSNGDTSLVPFSRDRQVVLRKNTAVVVFDHASKEMATLNTEADGDRGHDTCPTCLQAWPAPSTEGEDASAAISSPDLIDPHYFRMLSHTLQGSPQTPPSTSPRRRLVHALGSPREFQSSSASDSDFFGSAATTTDAHGISSSAFSQDYFRKFFVEEKVLGTGGKGVVLLVAHVLDGVRLGHFACKRVPVGDDHEWLKKILTEVQTLQNLSHQNLVSYRHVWLEDVHLSKFGPSVPCAFILQQYCDGGDLHNYVCGPSRPLVTPEELKKRMRRRSKGETEMPDSMGGPKKLSMDEIYSFFKDITSGLRFLHASGYIHRDLKPSNCLLHQVGGETRVLVSDFGEVQATTAIRKSTGATGTISYCAPEVLRRESPVGPYQNFTVKSDVFSLGMILYFLCFATLPYRNADVFNEDNEDLDDLRAEILHWSGLDGIAKRRPELPEKLYVFLRRLLAIEPTHRPSAAEIDYAIRTGVGLADFQPPRDLDSTSPEDISQSARITLIDSPAPPSTPVACTSQRHVDQMTALPHHASARLRQLSRSDIFQRRSEQDDGSYDHRTRSAQSSDEPLPASSHPSWDLTITPESSPFLLPPPTPSRREYLLAQLSSSADYLSHARTLRGGLLLAKVISLNSACQERAVNPIILYPLLVAAILEATADHLSNRVVLGSCVVHIVVLAVSLRKDTLCVA